MHYLQKKLHFNHKGALSLPLNMGDKFCNYLSFFA